MNKFFHIATFVVSIGLALSACVPLTRVKDPSGSATPQPMPQSTTREAQVQSVNVQVMNTDPPQVNAVVRGSLSEACATLAPSQVSYASNVFEIQIYAVSPADRGCAQVITPFETTIALETSNLTPGSYTVTANGVSAVFALQASTPVPTEAPTLVPTVVPTVAPTSTGCTDKAAFVSDVSIPDNMQVAPNTPFTKIWRLRNTGTCVWNGQYLVSWISGTTMTQQPAYYLTGLESRVNPGQTMDVSVGMTAPAANGSYASYWGLKGRNGQLMPIQGGANGNSFYVKIKVNDGSVPPGEITAASIDIELEQGSGTACTPGATYLVHAYITADGPTTASYEVGSSSGQISAGYFEDESTHALLSYVTSNVTFEPELFQVAHTQTITRPFRFVGPYPYPDDITVSLRVNGGPWHSSKLHC